MRRRQWWAWADLLLFVLLSPAHLLIAIAYQLYEHFAHGKKLWPIRDLAYRKLVEDSKKAATG